MFVIHSDAVKLPSAMALSKNFQDFIQKILCKDTSQRITIEDALSHAWVNGLTDKQAAKKRNSLLNQEIAPYLQHSGLQSKIKKGQQRKNIVKFLKKILQMK